MTAGNTCPECGAVFECGMQAGRERCWCADLPPRLPVPATAAAACLCPACLQRRIATAAQEPPAAR